MMETRRRTRSVSELESNGSVAPPNGSSAADEQPKKRRSRFDQPPPNATASQPAATAAQSTAAAAMPQATAQVAAGAVDPSFAAKVQQAAEIQKKIQDQLASVMAAAKNKPQKRALNLALRLDEQGREIDEHGNVVQSQGPVKTVKANLLAQKKAANPYLAHKTVDEQDKLATVDPRLKIRDREKVARKALNFVDPGTYIRQAEIERHKEERRMLAGISSNRTVGLAAYGNAPAEEAPAEEADLAEESGVRRIMGIEIPPPQDGGVVPAMEWWDEQFLPKELRAAAKTKAADLAAAFDQLNIEHSKTFKLVQHPVPVKQGSEPKALEDVLPMYLTKKERKRIRRQARMERELEKRDKIMMGLIEPPEPKFKLSNFMKVLGDQAVADPSKVEQRVLLQMRQRQLNHEMRNQARKLTPQERREKKRKKLQEDTSREVHVAVFRVKDLNDIRHRFKVDVNAQQYNLTGIALICHQPKTALVVVEGGPKGIKKFTKLMLRRIKWNVRTEQEDEEDEESSEEADEGGEDEEVDMKTSLETGDNRCDLLWRGIVVRRTFHAFRFQECRTSVSARKVMDAKAVAHYWDMAARADAILESQEL